MLERCTPETKAAMDTVLDCFAASDGGIALVKFYMLIETLDMQAQEGNAAAAEIMRNCRGFAKLIDFAKA
jgi:hypothetical protein